MSCHSGCHRCTAAHSNDNPLPLLSSGGLENLGSYQLRDEIQFTRVQVKIMPGKDKNNRVQVKIMPGKDKNNNTRHGLLTNYAMN